MKKVKTYIDPDLAKKKIARYKYWSVKDETGVTICTSDENNPDNKSFADILKQVNKDNIDAEIQVRYGTSEPSARQNPPIFIKINEEIEWVEPEEETVSINGVPHPVDKNGNVNINFRTPATNPLQTEKAVPIDTIRQELEIQLEGIRREHALKEEKWAIDVQNKLMEQTLKFREMMLAERESRLLEREQTISQEENHISKKKQEIQSDVASYLKQVPSALGAIIKEFSTSKKSGLGKSTEKPRKERKAADFTIEDEETPIQEEESVEVSQEEIEQEITKYEEQEQQEQEHTFENSNTIEEPEHENNDIEFEELTPSTNQQNKSSPEINNPEEKDN
jgi:hypothetical protein